MGGSKLQPLAHNHNSQPHKTSLLYNIHIFVVIESCYLYKKQKICCKRAESNLTPHAHNLWFQPLKQARHKFGRLHKNFVLVDNQLSYYLITVSFYLPFVSSSLILSLGSELPLGTGLLNQSILFSEFYLFALASDLDR